MKKRIALSAIAATFSAAVFIYGGCALNDETPPDVPVEPKKVSVSFVIGKEIVYTATVDRGSTVCEPDLIDRDENAFIVWTYNGSVFDFDRPIKNDTVMTATLSKKFSVTFKADGKTVKTCEYSYYDRTIIEPKIPYKKGYSSQWESYQTTGGNITVNAVYTPVVYYVDYFVDSAFVQSIACTVEDCDSLIPDVPYRNGYTGKWTYEQITDTKFTASAEYEPKRYTANFYVDEKLVKSVETYFNEELILPEIPEKKYYDGRWSERCEIGDIYEYRAVYTPTEYTVSFVVGNDMFAVESYNITNINITAPPVPEKRHYVGKWSDFSLSFEDITVRAEYTPVEYSIEFAVGEIIIDTKYYTVEATDVTPPLCPEKEGYACKWAHFDLNGGNLIVQAEYTAIEYVATFVADGKFIGDVIYTLDDLQIKAPAVPDKSGYVGEWQSYSLGVGGARINAVYTPIIYSVTFVADGKAIAVERYTVENKSITPPAVPEKEGYMGKWAYFELNLKDATVEAEYTAIEYIAAFRADGRIIEQITYTMDDRQIKAPAVPEKKGYTGAWQSFELGVGGALIDAVYTPIVYTVTFIADNVTVSVISYTVENKNITPPAVPDKEGYVGQWKAYTLDCRDIIVNAEYFTNYYIATFVADGKVVAQIKYSADGGELTPPPVPEKSGYDGKWESYVLNGDITVRAEYAEHEYKVEFIADGRVVRTESYTISKRDVTIPEVPKKEGYSGVWENFTLSVGDVTVNAEYSPIIYKVKFFADRNAVAECQYTVLNKDITIPEVPKKEGYSGVWENFELSVGDVTVNAVYEAEIYTVKFVADGKVVAEYGYSVSNSEISVPDVPLKNGYSGAWENFELSGGNITVNAIYTLETYTVYFICDGKVVAERRYTVLNKDISVPDAPVKSGYESCWEKFELTYGNLFVHAVFAPIKGTDGLVYTLDGNGYAVTGYKGNDSEVIVPAVHEGLPVTKIGDGAFDCSEGNAFVFEEITICENVQIIGANAFNNCSALKRVNLPDSLTAISQSAFYNCSSLESIVLPANITRIEDNTFNGCGLTSVTLPENLEYIGAYAFYGCNRLEEIIIPDSVVKIDSVAFMYCSSLKKIVFGKNLTEICQYAFLGCDNLSYAEFKDAQGWQMLGSSDKVDVSAQFSDAAAAARIIAANPTNAFKKQ